MRLLSKIGVATAACALVVFMPATAQADLLLTASPNGGNASCTSDETGGKNLDFLANDCGFVTSWLHQYVGSRTIRVSESGDFVNNFASSVVDVSADDS